MATKQKILIVDDDNNIAELVALYLTKECFETKIVNDGEEALKQFHIFHPDLIFWISCFRALTDTRYAVRSVTPPIYRSLCFPPREKPLTKSWDWNLEQMITSSSF